MDISEKNFEQTIEAALLTGVPPARKMNQSSDRFGASTDGQWWRSAIPDAVSRPRVRETDLPGARIQFEVAV